MKSEGPPVPSGLRFSKITVLGPIGDGYFQQILACLGSDLWAPNFIEVFSPIRLAHFLEGSVLIRRKKVYF
jgi:hypothetical protein